MRARPYWHVDAKWVAGLLLFFTLHGAALIFVWYRATSRDLAVDAMTILLATAFSPDGIDAQFDKEEVRQTMPRTADGAYAPIKGLRIAVTEKELDELTPRELRLRVFGQIAGPLYDRGPEGAGELADDPQMRDQIVSGSAMLALISRKNHDAARTPLIALSAASGVLALVVVLFSRRWGRLASPGVVLALAALPWAGMFSLLTLALERPGAGATAPGSGIVAAAAYALTQALPPLAREMAGGFVGALLAGLALIIAAVLGTQFSLAFRRKTPITGQTPSERTGA